MIGAALLVVAYSLALFAGFFSPYRYDTRYSEHSFQKPDIFSLNFSSPSGQASFLRPSVFGGRTVYEGGRAVRNLDPNEEYRLTWFTSGEEYEVLGLFPASRHLFGLEPVTDLARTKWAEAQAGIGNRDSGVPGYPLLLLGADNYGRDIFSRLLFGGQISLTMGLIGILISFTIGLTVGGISGYYGDNGMILHGAGGLAVRAKTASSLFVTVSGRMADVWAGDKLFCAGSPGGRYAAVRIFAGGVARGCCSGWP